MRIPVTLAWLGPGWFALALKDFRYVWSRRSPKYTITQFRARGSKPPLIYYFPNTRRMRQILRDARRPTC